MLKFNPKNLLHLAVSIILLLFLASITPVLRNPAMSILKYPLGALTLIKHEAGGIIFYHRNMVENERLSRSNDLLKRKLNELNEIYLENVRLKNLLLFKKKTNFKVIIAQVLSRSSDSWSSAIIIDKGRYHGIRSGFVVIDYLGLVGRVTDTTEFTSKVILINDPNMGVSALDQRSRQEGLVSGTLGSSLIMKYLPKDADVQVSDTVITSGLTDMYPKGILIGKIIGVGEEFSGLSRYCLIKPAVNLSNLEEVLVIIP